MTRLVRKKYLSEKEMKKRIRLFKEEFNEVVTPILKKHQVAIDTSEDVVEWRMTECGVAFNFYARSEFEYGFSTELHAPTGIILDLHYLKEEE